MSDLNVGSSEAPSSSEEGVGGGGPTRELMLERAASMRSNPTEPERRMWMVLRDSRLRGFKFRRQVVMGSRIEDFFCPAKGVIVEVDGETHDRPRDLANDMELERRTGFVTLRFTNTEVMREMDEVVTRLALTLERRPDRWSGVGSTTPQPPPLKRRGAGD